MKGKGETLIHSSTATKGLEYWGREGGAWPGRGERPPLHPPRSFLPARSLVTALGWSHPSTLSLQGVAHPGRQRTPVSWFRTPLWPQEHTSVRG